MHVSSTGKAPRTFRFCFVRQLEIRKRIFAEQLQYRVDECYRALLLIKAVLRAAPRVKLPTAVAAVRASLTGAHYFPLYPSRGRKSISAILCSLDIGRAIQVCYMLHLPRYRTKLYTWQLAMMRFDKILDVTGCRCYYCCCLHIKPFFLPNISSTLSVRPDSSWSW